ncbi:MAG TPA: hypothetical protein GX702_02775 [Chloroflexi bacterium]|jgi:foldase protein PrsA|nr:hypothetical protein [Chloroflexota bacterium]
MRLQLRFLLVALLAVAILLMACRKTDQPTDPTPVPESTSTEEAATLNPDEEIQTRTQNVELALENIQRPDGDAIATVNGQDIPVDHYIDLMRLRLYTISDQYQIDWADENSIAMLGQIESQVIEQMVSMEVLRQRAASEDMLPGEDEIRQTSDEIQAEILMYGDYESWDEFMELNQITDDVYRSIVEESIILEKLVDKYAQVGEMEQINASHILVEDEELAQDLLEQIGDGADFAELAREHSQDTGSAEKGGELGWFPRGVMVPEFEEAAFALQPGEVSDVVSTDFGFHIIKITGREVRALEPYLEQEFQNRMFNAWVAEIVQEADIEVHVQTDVQFR